MRCVMWAVKYNISLGYCYTQFQLTAVGFITAVIAVAVVVTAVGGVYAASGVTSELV